MIAIARTEEPAELKRSKARDAWQSVPEVRSTLHDMQAGKCCYCEASIPEGGSRQQIEHFWPKAHYGDKRNLWTNLLLACDLCNRQKDDEFPLDNLGHPQLIDPTSPEVDPEDEMTFVTQFADVDEYRLVGQAVAINGSALGGTTIEVVGLSDRSHVQARRRHFELELLPWLRQYADACDRDDEWEKESLRGRLEHLMGGGAKYAGFVRAFAQQHRLPVTVPELGTA